MKLMHGDCLEVMSSIPTHSVDLVLTDPPYGTMGGMGKSINNKTGQFKRQQDAAKWDKVIDIEAMWQQLHRIVRPNGMVLLFSQEPFTTKLIMSANYGMPFCYRMAWHKNQFGNPLLAKVAPLNYYEDICVFTRKPAEMHQHHPLRDYFLSELARSKFTKPQINKLLGNSMSSHYFTRGIQFVVPSAKDYAKLQATGFWPLPYAELQRQHQQHKADFKQRYPRVFNLPAGKGHKSNIFTYPKDVPSLHPTQKPAALLADLIQTYSRPGDTVLDFTMGSGSTGQACQQTGRHFIGIEKDDHYFEVAANRLKAA